MHNLQVSQTERDARTADGEREAMTSKWAKLPAETTTAGTTPIVTAI
jgi:hypothetical protein